MIKKLFYAMMAGAMLFATSCQNGVDEVAVVEKSAVVSFSVNTPSLSTRAYGEGTLATQLQYAVYNEDGSLVEGLGEDGVFTVDNFFGVATIDLALVNGNKYQVVFWAAAPNAPYRFDAADAEVVVDYTTVNSNKEAYDAFFAATDVFQVNGNIQESVTLRRPFAQINIGASDVEQAAKLGLDLTNSAVTVANAYNTLNLKTGAASGEQVVEFRAAPVATGDFPVKDYQYIAMNYVLVNADKGLLDSVSFTCDNYTRTVTNVPVQRNYRTNIFGQLFTNNVEINIDLDQELDFNTPDEQVFYAFQHGGEVKLTQNMVVKNQLVVKGDVVLDLNGFTLEGGIEDSATATGADIAAIVVDGGSLTIKGEGTIKGTEYGVYAKSGNVTIKSGNFVAGTSAVQVYNATVNIDGGNFSATKSNVYVVNCIDSAYNNGTAKVNITGGTFKNFNPANNAAEGAGTSFVAEGYTVLAEGDSYTVVPGVHVATKDELLAAVQNTTPIYFAADINMGETSLYPADGAVINMEGKKFSAYSGNGSYSICMTDGNHATINNANMNSEGFYVAFSKLTFNSGKIFYHSSKNGRNLFYVASNSAQQAVVTINGGDFSIDLVHQDRVHYISAQGNAIVYINGGNFGAPGEDGYTPIQAVDGWGYTAKVIISGGTFKFNPLTGGATLAEGCTCVENNGVWTVSAE